MTGLQTLTNTIGRHLHAAPYAAVVLEGGFEEAGEAGRFRVEAGDVLIHCAFSAHFDRIQRRCVVLNIDLPAACLPLSSRVRVEDVDRLVRSASTDPREAAAILLGTAVAEPACADDPADLLAARLAVEPALSIEAWAQRAGRSRQTVFRRFRTLYGVGPARYRAEARARRAWLRIVSDRGTLADVAAAEGFSDQAHLTRELRALTGRTPGEWRRAAQHSFNTAGSRIG